MIARPDPIPHKTSAHNNALFQNKKILLFVILPLILTVCTTAEDTLKALQKKFPQRKAQLNELKDLMLSLADSGTNFRLYSAANGKDDLIDFFDKEGEIPVGKALETKFKSQHGQVLKTKALIHAVGIDYVSVDKERKAVWVTLEGGGVLASDKGYIYIGKGEIASFNLRRVLPIPNEDGWYAYD